MPSLLCRSDDRLRSHLEAGAATLGLALPAERIGDLLHYLAELAKWNAAYNLTAVRDPAEMLTRHLLDSLSVLPVLRALPAGATPLLDVGSGAGLPGLVLAIAQPGWSVTALDSNGKKARFMRHAVRSLALRNVEVAQTRVEDFHPGRGFAAIVSRAYASLGDFVAGTRHLLAPGGEWVAMKGKLNDTEPCGLPPDVRIRETHRLEVPGLREARHALILAAEHS